MNTLRPRLKDQTFEDWLYFALIDAFYAARKHKLGTAEEQRFEANLYRNILLLRTAILDKTYKPLPSTRFVVTKPALREIYAAAFRDRVVHHLLYTASAPWWETQFIDDCYSCREGKGTLYGIRRLREHILAVSHNYTRPAYCIKLDLKSHFMNIYRPKLYELITSALDRQPFTDPKIRELCRYLWRVIIFDNPRHEAVMKSSSAAFHSLPPDKLLSSVSLFGLPVGNLTSQLASNIFLDQLDWYIYQTLGYQHYGRYVDDFFIIVSEADYPKAKKDVAKIERFLYRQLRAVLHPKKRYFQEVKKGVTFLGFTIYPHCIVPSRRLRAGLQASARAYRSAQKSPEQIAAFHSLSARLGLLRHVNHYKLASRVLDELALPYSQIDGVISLQGHEGN